MRSRAEVMVASVRSRAAPMCATVRNRARSISRNWQFMKFGCAVMDGIHYNL